MSRIRAALRPPIRRPQRSRAVLLPPRRRAPAAARPARLQRVHGRLRRGMLGDTAAPGPAARAAAPGGVGSVAAAVKGYLASAEFADLAATTREGSRRRILETFAGQHGHRRIAELERRHVDEVLKPFAGKPGASRNFVSALRVLVRYSIECRAARARRPDRGHQDGQALARRALAQLERGGHRRLRARGSPIRSKARLALALLLYTGQRRGDVIGLGPRSTSAMGAIHLTQHKTGRPLAIPIHPELQAVLDATPGDQPQFPDERARRSLPGRPRLPTGSRELPRSRPPSAPCGSARPAQGLRAAPGRGRMLGADHRRHHRACELARGAEVYRRRRTA